MEMYGAVSKRARPKTFEKYSENSQSFWAKEKKIH